MSEVFDVLVVGAGVTGLLTALRLVERGYSVAIVDEFPLGKYASTRNQGWLLGGAIYPYDAIAARAFQAGMAELVAEFPSAVDGAIRCYYYFRDERARNVVLRNCARHEVPAIPRTLEEVAQREWLLEGTLIQHFLEVQDRRVDTSRLLLSVADRAIRQGAVVIERPEALKITRVDGKYVTRAGEMDIVAAFLVSASGAAEPWNGTPVGLEPPITITAATVPIPWVSNIIAAPQVQAGVKVVPYLDGAYSGVAITVSMGNQKQPDVVSRLCTSLVELFPKLPSILAERHDSRSASHGSPCSIYECLVRHPKGPGKTFFMASDRHYVVVPAKMSLAASLAQRCANAILADRSPGSGRSVWSDERVMSVAQRRSMQASTHVLSSDGRLLDIRRA